LSLVSRFLPIRTDLPIEQAIKGILSAYVTMFFGVLIAPLFEEVYFRGLMYPVLVRAFRSAGATLAVSVAVIITSAAFALVHGAQLGFSWPPLLVIFLVGLVLTLVRAHTRSLAATWLVHVSYNSTLFGLMLVQTRGFHRLS
jgi:membrane protease YdiL (CAAX protease family)